MKKIILFITIIISTIGCETREQKHKEANEIVMTFISNLSFENYDLLEKSYPNFKEIYRYTKPINFVITSTTIEENNSIIVIGKSTPIQREMMFILEKTNNSYKIVKSKGISAYYNSSLYEYCKKTGIIGTGDYDIEISKNCRSKEQEFKDLFARIKTQIEQNVILENHTLKKNYGYISGDVTIKNNSGYDIPGYSYDLYIYYTDNNNNVISTTKCYSNFEPIIKEQSKTIHVFESNSDLFRKIKVSLNLTNERFIESIITKYVY